MLDKLRETRSLFRDISRMRAVIFDRMMAPHGLTMSQTWVLAHLFDEDNLTQTELAARMRVGTVTVGGLIDRLEARGFVVRHTDSVDRRAKRVRLTPSAIPIGRIMHRYEAEVHKLSFAGLDEEDEARLFHLLTIIRNNLSEALNMESAGESAQR